MQKRGRIEWDTYPETPEHFRETVRMAAEAGLGKPMPDMTVKEESGKETVSMTGKAEYAKAAHDTAAGHREKSWTMRKAGGRRCWYRVWLPAAAVLAVGSLVFAAGNGWLKEHLMERGFSESEAEALIETEPVQQAENVPEEEYLQWASKEMDWSDSILTVSEAYFDGNSLYFIAEASEEAARYEIFLRDHASINGYDGMTSLVKLEDEEKYLGQIELTEPEDAEEILQSGAVLLEMTVIAYPAYEGRIFYTWKDHEAYEEIFGTGAFESDYGLCYVMTQEDAIAGYTPQKLEVEVPLTEEARTLIEQYREEGTPEPVTAWVQETDGSGEKEEVLQNDQSGTEAAAEAVAADAAAAELSGADAAAAGEDVQQTQTLADSTLEVKDGRVTGVLTGADITLTFDADLVNGADTVYTGTLLAEPYSEAVLKSLYEDGDTGLWTESGDGWQYGEQHIYVSGTCEMTNYQNDEVDLDQEGGEERSAGEQWEQILTRLGVQATELKEFAGDETQKWYRAQLLLEGVPMAFYSQWNASCSVGFINDSLVGLNIPGNLTVVEKEAVELPEMEMILEHLESYIADGSLTFLADSTVEPVTEIALEYYIDLTKQGLIFRPVWNIKLTFWLQNPDGTPWSTDGHIYMDALTGALVRDTTGW